MFLWNTAGNTPVDDGQRVYVWANGVGQSFVLEALRLSDGQEVWRYASAQLGPGELQVVNGILYYTDNTHSHTYALNASTGTLLWEHAEPVVGNSVLRGMQAVGPVVYLWGGSGITALRAQDGAVLWHVPHQTTTGFSVTVQGDRLYVTDDVVFVLDALSANTGKQLWTFAQGEFGGDFIGAADQVVYVNDGGILYALQASAGTILWRHALPDRDYPTAGDVRHFTLTPTMLYETLGNNLMAFSLKDGAPRWGYTGPGLNKPKVTVVGAIDGTVYVQTFQAILAWHASDGQQLWDAPIGSESPGILLGTTIYVAQAVYSGDQPHQGPQPAPTCRLSITLSSLDTQTGAVNWQQKHSHPCS